MALLQRRPRELAPASVLDRPLSLGSINIDVLAFGVLILLSVITHLWALGHMALHHDESIHAWTSWRFYVGSGNFTCAGGRTAPSYCYDPIYHGPSLYLLTALSYFLFGDGDAQARIPQAVCGILLVASTWSLRPYFGRWGALLAGVLMAFSPSLLYYTRFARHDGLMILWTFWMVLGFFRYLDTGRARYLYLLAAGTALSMATHELYYILFFIFGSFVIVRLLDEHLPHRAVLLTLAGLVGLCLVVAGLNPQVGSSLRVGGLAVVFGTVFALGFVLVRVWGSQPVLTQRLVTLWRDERRTLWTALGVLAALYVINYSVLFTDPRGIIDGLYRGIEYWLGSQHEYARGKQPWYYYLFLLPIYEPLALFGATSAALYLFAWGRERILALVALLAAGVVLGASQWFGSVSYVLALIPIGVAVYLIARGWWRGELPPGQATPVPEPEPETGVLASALSEEPADPIEPGTNGTNGLHEPAPAAARPLDAESEYATRRLLPEGPLFPLFLAFWFIASLVSFSWAGEKMPWLLVHIALPGNLLLAWALGRLIETVNWRGLSDRSAGLVPVVTTLMLVAFGVSMWRIQNSGVDQQGQSSVSMAIVPLLVLGLLIFALLTIGQRVGTKVTLAMVALTLAGLTGAYMIRATWMVVYQHPDTPREPLVYVQSSPDVPLVSQEIHMLAINQTRNTRTADDPAGGLSMPVIMDVGANGDNSLAWPFQWYFRDLKNVKSQGSDFFRNATADTFLVDSPGGGDKILAPVVMVASPDVTDAARQALEANYIKRYDTKLNWWFPEGDIGGCDPRVPGYKQFYYSTSSIAQAKADPSCASLPVDTLPYQGVFAPLLWPFQAEHWGDNWKFLLYRELPEPLRLDGRLMQVWVRRDLAPNGGGTAGAVATDVYKLVSRSVFGATQALNQPRGVAVGPQGNVYVVDTGNNTLKIFNPDGSLRRSVGSLGSGPGQFNEPRGVALDAQGNIYVADTWNARVVKLNPEGEFITSWGSGNQDLGNGRRATITDGTSAGNAAEPLGMFGPRGLAVDDQGRVFVSDTGNKRIIMTDSNGKFLFQWGAKGSDVGQFNEPIGIGVDGQGRVYVGDTWNGRVQVFERAADKSINPVPSVTWPMAGWQPNTYDDPYLAVSKSGDIYASMPGRNQVLAMDQRGVVTLRWGGKGLDNASFNLPSGLAVGPDGQVYVVDRGNNRVMQFELPGVPK